MDTLDTVKKIMKWIDDMPRVHDLKWEVEQLVDARDELFSQSKFKVGQKVQIIKEQNITVDHKHGWYGFRNQLVVGAIGEITEVNWNKKRGFSYAVKFTFHYSSFCNFDENELAHITSKRKGGIK
jgi:hypothetical protein